MDKIDSSKLKYSIDLSFEEISLPPFQDILVLGKNSQHGKLGLSKTFELLRPNGFEIVEVKDNNIEAVFINKRILSKISLEEIISILESKVFQFVAEGDLLRVNFKISISYTNIEHETW